MYTLHLKIKGLPPTPNRQSGNYRAANKIRQAWKMYVEHAFIFGRNEKPEKPLAKVKLVLIRHSAKAPDYDGLVGSFKCVVDALRVGKHGLGIFEDDRMSNFVGEHPDYRWSKCSPNSGHIEIILEEAV